MSEIPSHLTRSWTLYVCPWCGRHTTDSDQIDCDCDVGHWDEVTVVPAGSIDPELVNHRKAAARVYALLEHNITGMVSAQALREAMADG